MAQPSFQGTQEFALPHYVNLSVVPAEYYCYRDKAPFVGSRSSAKTELDDGELVTYDPLCNTSDELWRFFMTHLTKPTLNLQIAVSHVEVHTVRYKDANGHMRTRQEHRTISDMSMDFDFSGYVNPDFEWNFIVASSNSVPPIPVSFQAALDEYCNMQSSFKEISMQKQVNWDLSAFQAEITRIVESHPVWRTTGYSHTTAVEWRLGKNVITVRAPGKLSSLSHNDCIRCLCVVSCLCIVAWPLYTYLHKPSKNKLMAMWESAQPWQVAFNKNAPKIYQLTASKPKGYQANAI